MTTTDRHRIDIDRSENDKVAFLDHPAAPLGTDEEAGGGHAASDPAGTSASQPGKQDPVDAGRIGKDPPSGTAEEAVSSAREVADTDTASSLSPIPATFAHLVEDSVAGAAPTPGTDDGESGDHASSTPTEEVSRQANGHEPADTGSAPADRPASPWLPIVVLGLGLGAVLAAFWRKP